MLEIVGQVVRARVDAGIRVRFVVVRAAVEPGELSGGVVVGVVLQFRSGLFGFTIS